MTLFAIITGFTTFIVALIFHIAVWRVVKPKKQILMLFAVLLFVPFIVFCLLLLINLKYEFVSFTELFASGLLYTSIICAYIQTYPALQVKIPSLHIVYNLKKYAEGLTAKEIGNLFSEEDLVVDRIDDLFAEKFIYDRDGKLFLSRKGRFLADVFYFYRKVYGLEAGKG